jgi:hypothetical protein
MKTISFAASVAAALLCGTALTSAAEACSLANGIKHVVYLQFDNTHFHRDNVNVPSDLEQMPHLLNFMKQNGVVLSNDHTQLISHTANGILTSMTGAYSDRVGAGAVANSFNYFNSSTNNANSYVSSFVYWTDPVNVAAGDSSTGTDTSYVLVNENGQNAPAPWVAYTRAGCDVGAIGIADIDLENTSSDILTAFGSTSNEYKYVTSGLSGYPKPSTGIKTADFEGIAIHCGQGSAICAAASNLTTVQADGLPLSKPTTDALPQEPGGYTGYQALFGHRYAVPALQSILGQTPNGQLTDYQGNLIGYQTASGGSIVQSKTISGFPGFNGMFPFVTLAYAEEMLTAGVPVVYGYFTDAHDHSYGTQDGVNPAGSSFAYGPGQQGYVNQLQQYDAAFATFFANLAAKGIDQTNTLFVILVEEGDKFAGGRPTPSNCDGVNTPCTYPPTAYTFGNVAIGEVDVNIDTLLSTLRGNSTAFNVHTDQAPAYYLNGNPAPTSAVTRQFARDLLALKYNDPYLNNASLPVTVAIADQAELSALHMVTGDPQRTPTLVGFNNDNVYGGIGAVTYGSSNPGCGTSAATQKPVCTYPGYAWNHGGIGAVVRQTWTSMAGPGVLPTGIDGNTWTDHTDVRATMFALLGLQDDYLHDGRVVVENLDPTKLPATISGNLAAYQQLATAYKQLTAPFGTAGSASLTYATKAIGSGSGSSDTTYATYLSNINGWVAQRNTLIGQIKPLLNNAEQGVSFDPTQVPNLVSQANALTNQVVGWSQQ